MEHTMKQLMEEFPLNKGDYVTVVDAMSDFTEIGGSGLGFRIIESNDENHKYFGEVLEVLVAVYPYALFRKKSRYDSENGRTVKLDLRDVKLMKLTQEYVDIYTEKE